MLGFNGGLIGTRRDPTRGQAPGIWLPNEQTMARRLNRWPAGDDPFFEQVSLLLPFEGVDKSVGFFDASDRALPVARIGRPVLRSSVKRWGGTSVRFDGGNDWLEVGGDAALVFPGDYTVEAWVWMDTANSGLQTVIELGSYQSGLLIRCSGNSLDVWCNGSSLGNIANFFTSQNWHFIQMARQGINTWVAVDGTVRLTSTISFGTVNSSANVTRIGYPTHASGQALTGFIDDLRITKGVGRPNEVPASPFIFLPPPPTPADPIPVGAITYSQSSVFPGTAPASNALMTNGSFSDTGAATNNDPSAWISMDLGRAYPVGHVVIGMGTASIPGGWNRSYTENRTLQHSMDGVTWVTLFNIGAFSADDIYTFAVDFTARFIRLSISNSWVVASEFYALAPGQLL